MAKKPNILVIWGDDIGQSNLSCYTHGLMGYRTPNIDRIAKEGMLFTDSYGEQSCTAGRSSFITGQSVYRTGLSKVGTPGAPVGMSDKIVTIAALLKEQGYATGQFGKNHLGDLNHMLPTNHGFDEFYGNLYHLNAEEEPEMVDYPKDPAFHERFGPRGVIHSWATDKDDPTEQPRWGRVGKQKIEDTGPLTRKRMETCDDDFVAKAQAFIRAQEKAGKPWFVWVNTTHMHFITHTKESSLGQAGRWQSPYHDTMIDHDRNVGQMLDLLDELGIAKDTFVQYSTDNGPHRNTWPDAGMTPFRSEKNTNWEGAFRIPMLVRWPGRIEAGSVCNGIVQHHDWLPTFLAMAGAPEVKEKLKSGYKAIGRTYKNHIDGYDLLPYLIGKQKEAPRQFFFYISDDGDILALRYDNWKIVFMEQRCQGTLQVWAEPFTRLRVPKMFNLRTDPYESADVTSNSYYDWFLYHGYFMFAAQAAAAKFAETFKDFPPIQRPNTFTIDDAIAKMGDSAAGSS
ncbi:MULTISPECIES: arylsulfatase [Ramlibacter]|uniref:Sulfatase-like hydrolase/transferase n=1 Tax=Ramlibacter pinisoli TaxID=2682844 RepID=A0A6N8IPI2_9BURK|nr:MULTISPECIES: arylsulfatase [Ramlibacter]MBA2963791.1 arylsulfatase [Ramlibacter sp. CGMCC 1.13660]MVQ28757.1 sulfatase-like hydrolase/transferase [Ramlibacter pinisoli]